MSQINALTQILITPEAQAEMSQAQTKVESLATAAAWPCDSPRMRPRGVLTAIQRSSGTWRRTKEMADPLTSPARKDGFLGHCPALRSAKEYRGKSPGGETRQGGSRTAAKALAVDTQGTPRNAPRRWLWPPHGHHDPGALVRYDLGTCGP